MQVSEATHFYVQFLREKSILTLKKLHAEINTGIQFERVSSYMVTLYHYFISSLIYMSVSLRYDTLMLCF